MPEVAERYIKEFWVDAKGLNVREATVHPRATENIDEIQRIITELVEKGYAYTAGGDVYFRSKKFEGYGKHFFKKIENLFLKYLNSLNCYSSFDNCKSKLLQKSLRS